MRLVHARYPGLIDRAPAVELATLPTPVRRLDGISRATGAEVWAKLDGETHRELGGSKLRALEFQLGEFAALKKPVVAYGPEASGWLLGLAHFGKALGLDVDYLTFPMPWTPASRHKAALLAGEAGGRLKRGRDFGQFVLRFLHSWIRVAGGGWELAPPGGSGPISTVGYVNAALELADQVARGECPSPDVIVAPLGSGGLVTGLALGLAIADLRAELIGVSIAPRIVANKAAVIRLLLQVSWVLDLDTPRMAETRVVHRHRGTYGLPTRAGEEATEMFRDLEGIELDPVYSSKAAACALELARGQAGKRVLFWQTYRRPDLKH